MKKSKIILLLIFVFSIGMQGIAQKKKVALVTFYIDKQIDVSRVGGITGWVYYFKELAQNPDFDLQPIVDESWDKKP